MKGKLQTLNPTASSEELALIEFILMDYPQTKKEIEKQAYLVEKKGVLLKYKTRDELKEKINSYFFPTVNPDTGQPQQAYMVSLGGLAVHLGVTRTTLIRYGQDKEYYGIIELAKNRIETRLVELGMSKALDSSFTKFYLKNNHERTDKHEVETTTTEKKTFEIQIVQPSPVQ